MRYALVYGLIAGTIIILTMIAGFELTAPDSFTHTIWYGYLLMFVVLAFIFVGVKRYRDVEGGGVVRFWRAFGLGLVMAAVAGIAYVLIFEIYLAASDYRYLHEAVAKAETAADRAQIESLLFDPPMRMMFVFLEIFPPGFVVALFSAALLRNPRLLPARAKAQNETQVFT
jgi:hypothetical protein